MFFNNLHNLNASSYLGPAQGKLSLKLLSQYILYELIKKCKWNYMNWKWIFSFPFSLQVLVFTRKQECVLIVFSGRHLMDTSYPGEVGGSLCLWPMTSPLSNLPCFNTKYILQMEKMSLCSDSQSSQLRPILVFFH